MSDSHPHSPSRPASSCAGGCACSADGAAEAAPLPSWPRIAWALGLAAAAEGAHWAQRDGWAMALALGAIALTGLGVYRTGLRDLLRLHLGIHALMAVAVSGAFIIGQWPEAAMVMALYVAAERIEGQAMQRAHSALRSLLDLAPPMAQVLQADASVQHLPVEQVAIGAWVRVAPGARVPLDGHVAQGHSSVNQAPITGESQMVDKGVGDVLYAGSINQQGELLMQVSALSGDTVLARIVQMVEQAQAARAPTQRFVDRFAQVYTPLVFALACLLAGAAPFVWGWSVWQALYQALALLVISCPCALVISTPVTLVSALTAAARRGILIKSGSALEQVRNLRVLALDKTGTLTTGQPSLVHWQFWPEASTAAWADLPYSLSPLDCALALACRSDHPVSRAIAAGLAAHRTSAALPPVQSLQALPGLGVQAHIGGQLWWLGNERWARQKFDASETSAATWSEAAPLSCLLLAQEQQGRSVTLLGCEGRVVAVFAVADPLRPQASVALAQLQALGVRPVMLSGDNPTTVRAVADTLGIADARAALLPQDKLDALAGLQRQYGLTAMVGDGINDAPALAQADVGFAMGTRHSSAVASETASIVLMNDDLRCLAESVALGRRTHTVLWQNITLALSIKAGFLVLAAWGQASLWLAVLADMGVSLLVVANGLRLRRGLER